MCLHVTNQVHILPRKCYLLHLCQFTPTVLILINNVSSLCKHRLVHREYDSWHKLIYIIARLQGIHAIFITHVNVQISFFRKQVRNVDCPPSFHKQALLNAYLAMRERDPITIRYFSLRGYKQSKGIALRSFIPS